MRSNNKFFTPVEDFAARHDLTTELVIEMIRDGVLGGKLFNDHWFVDRTSRHTQKYLGQTQEKQREIVNVPITSLSRALQIIGIIATGFGIIVGLYLLISFSQPAVSILSIKSEAQLTFYEIAIALGLALFYCSLGVLCLSVAKILEKSQALSYKHADTVPSKPDNDVPDDGPAERQNRSNS